MSTVTSVSGHAPEAYMSPNSSSRPAAPQTQSSTSWPVDQVDLTHATLRETSETGRIALQLDAGNLTSDQATQLYHQVASIQYLVKTDEQANGGSLSSQDALAVNQAQTQLSGIIYSEAHNGAAVPTTSADPDVAGKREALLAGRITLNEQAGNLSSAQAQPLMQQQAQIDQQIAADKEANGGSLTQAQAQQINQLQDAANKQVYQAVHNAGSGT